MELKIAVNTIIKKLTPVSSRTKNLSEDRKKKLAERCARAGQYFALKGNLRKSRSLIKASIKIYPNSAEVNKCLGEYYLKKKKPKKAVQYFAKALELQEDDQACTENSQCFASSNELKTAVELATQAVQLNSHNSIARFIRGSIFKYWSLFKQNYKELADIDLTLALRQNPYLKKTFKKLNEFIEKTYVLMKMDYKKAMAGGTAFFYVTFGGGLPSFDHAKLADYLSRNGGDVKLVQLVKQIESSVSMGGIEEAMAGDVYASPISTSNPRDQFRKLGWEVYDDIESLKNRPRRKYEYKTMPDQFAKNIQNPNPSLRTVFDDKELNLMYGLVDRNLANDELRFVFVSADDYVSFTLLSKDKDIGKSGIYVAQKKLDKNKANQLRRISPDYR